ncbi:hypothetical protein OIO90_003163 [Microbotryomycetes sp. JL221]|nr:hypothetical protein OIO90_003163 [Microbotryomycetes sp. JL221]
MSTCLSPASTPAHRLPGPPRRPSALRRTSSSSSTSSFTLLHSVPRFSPDPVTSYLPPPIDHQDAPSPTTSSRTRSYHDSFGTGTLNRSDVIGSHHSAKMSKTTTEAYEQASRSNRGTSFSGACAAPLSMSSTIGNESAAAPGAATVLRHAQSCGPPTTSTNGSPPPAPNAPATSSLLQRRKSSCSSQGRPGIALALSELESKLPTLKVPSPPLARIPVDSLDKLDDTIPKTVIGVSSAAVTPAMSDGTSPCEGDGKVIVEKPFRSTKTIVKTPFPERKSYIDESEDEQGDSEVDEGYKTQSDSKQSEADETTGDEA